MADTNNPEENKPRRKKKKAKEHAGHHGGAWKVAFADFMTAMMALFLVLWLVSQADTKLKEAIASHFRSPGIWDTMQGGILSQAKKVSKEPTSLTSKDDEQTLFAIAQKLEKAVKTRPEFNKFKDQVKIKVTNDGLEIQLIDKADRVSFPSGSAVLSEEAKTILMEIAKGICDLPNKINIGGHTDNQSFASDNVGYTNWELSADRANAARRVLQSVCVLPSQIHRVIGFADTEPLVPEDKSSPSNRRISITILRLSKTEDSKNEDVETDEKQISNKLAESISQDLDEKSKKTAEKVTISKEAAESNKTETSDTEAKTENSNSSDSEKDEPVSDKKTAKAKLMSEGKVKVGEPDIVPDKPKIKSN